MNRRNFFKGALASLAAMVAAPFLPKAPKVLIAQDGRPGPKPESYTEFRDRFMSGIYGKREWQVRYICELLMRQPDASVLVCGGSQASADAVVAEVRRRVAPLNPRIMTSVLSTACERSNQAPDN